MGPFDCRGHLRLPCLLVPLVLALLLVAPASSHAAGSGLFVTYAARYCPSYTAISANRARNNIQESLKDLGPDTTYTAGQAIDPAKELAGQPTCTPLENWRFSLGTGYKSRAVAGPWGSLSIVTGAYPTTLVTKPSVPLLNTLGQDTGKELEGAVTVELTDAQADRAAKANSLWLQGGTTTDPILNVPFPDEYGFGALRCAIDNLNGDNVEWISFPLGYRHVLCYAYYVKPPPTSGTIIVKKQVDAPAETAKATFRYKGNISFNSDKSFDIAAGPGSPGQTTFYRAEVGSGTPPWNFTEQVPDGWTVTGLTCSSAGGSTWVTNPGAGSASVALAAGDTVTCTYTDKLTPPTAGLSLRKVTLGRTGSFSWTVDDGSGDPSRTAEVTTEEEGVETDAVPSIFTLPVGTYQVTENIPAATGGRWKLDGVTCDGVDKESVQPLSVSLAAGDGALCVYTNRFVPDGTIRLHKTTLGAGGTTGFVVTPYGHDDVSLEQSATTTGDGDTAPATGDPTGNLPLGRYAIQETTPNDTKDGTWALQAVVCDNEPVPSDSGQITIRLTTEHPDVDCTFTNKFTKGDIPIPPDPKPDPKADVTVTKTPSRHTVTLGQKLDYNIAVASHGPDTALAVTLVDIVPKKTRFVAIRTSRGTCTLRPGTRLIICALGDMKKSAKAKTVLTVRPTSTGRIANRVAVNTGSTEPKPDNNVDSAVIRVKHTPRRPHFTG